MELIQSCSEQASTCWATNITSVLKSYSHISSVKQQHQYEGTGRADCAMAPGDRYDVVVVAVDVAIDVVTSLYNIL